MTTGKLQRLLRETADRMSDELALKIRMQELTYGQLERLATKIAEKAEQEIGSLRNKRIGVSLRHCPEAYAVLWACLVEGCTFVPINPAGPPERNQHIFQQAELDLILTTDQYLAHTIPLVEDVSILNLSSYSVMGASHVNRQNWTTDAAYLLFTSGSTGVPKGVPIGEDNLVSFLETMHDLYPLSHRDRVAQTFELTFDLAMYSTVASWLVGATVIGLTDEDKLAPVGFVQENAITVWFSVPSVVALAHQTGQLEPGTLGQLRLSMFCGEALAYDLAHKWFQASGTPCLNLYGPTEATIACSHFRIPDDAPRNGIVPIGEPYGSTQFGLLTEAGVLEIRPAESQKGELVVSGDQVFAGYWRNEEATDRAFVKTGMTQGPPERWYRTGDLAKFDRTNGWQYLGRIDEQVQVMGHRVELQDVETQLADHLNMDSSKVVVVPRHSSNGTVESLVGFIETLVEGQLVDINELSMRLPKYMVPSQIQQLDKLPLNSNGKVDRKRLAHSLSTLAKV